MSIKYTWILLLLLLFLNVCFSWQSFLSIHLESWSQNPKYSIFDRRIDSLWSQSTDSICLISFSAMPFIGGAIGEAAVSTISGIGPAFSSSSFSSSAASSIGVRASCTGGCSGRVMHRFIKGAAKLVIAEMRKKIPAIKNGIS